MPLPSFHEVQFGYDKTLKGYDYNPEKAKALMKEAGYANGFKYTIYARSAWTSQSQAVAGYWKDIGIDCEVKPIDGAIFSRDMTAKAIKTGCSFTSGGMTPWDVGFRLREYYCPPDKGGSGWSFCNNPMLTEKINDMLGTFNNEPLRESKMKTILAILADELPSRIGTLSPNRMFGYGSRVESAVPGLGGGFQYPHLLKLKE